MKKTFLITVIIILASYSVFAQYIPIGTPALEDYYRREQLLGRLDSNISFTLRPILSTPTIDGVKDIFFPDTSTVNSSKGITKFSNGKGYLSISPFSIQTRVNSGFPYGWNDGAMIPAKGPQVMVTGGIFLKFGFLTIQFKPEFVHAGNTAFEGFASVPRSDAELVGYYRYYNYIDQPERLTNGAYTKAFLGQSSIRLNFDPVSIGLSNENLWWGPGINNSLILSNNAPGFKHLTINTTRPVKFFLGHFEGQMIFGRLDGTNLPPIDVTTRSNGQAIYIPKNGDWRYFTGFNINYQPKWLNGLTIGLTRTFQAYKKDVNSIANYVPFLFPYQKENTDNGDPIPRDQRTSVYARWLLKKAHAEVYFEYGVNDNSYNYRDFVGSPDHSRAYIFGIRKMVTLNTVKDEHLLFSTEVTQTSQTADRLVRINSGWYTHYQVKQGYTHLGQLIGAGGGGNMQMADVSWVQGLKKVGVTFERYENNTDLADRSFASVDGNSRNWVNVSLALHAEWDYKNFIFNFRVQPVKALNYQWVMRDYNPNTSYIPYNNAYNLFAQLGATYRF